MIRERLGRIFSVDMASMLRRMLRVALPIALVAGLAACAAPARMESMVVTAPESGGPQDSSLLGSLYVEEVKGGEETNPLWTSEVDNEAFRGALVESLRSQGLLNEDRAASRYLLRANLLGMSQPIMGFRMTVTSHVSYEVTEKDKDSLYFGDSVETPYTAGAGDAFLGTERLRLANEGSIRENIKEFLKRLMARPPEG